MQAYIDAAPAHGHHVKLIDVADFHELESVDVAYLRLDTAVRGLSFAASRYAWDLGLRVVDDPRSLVTCMNKAHVQGLLEARGIPTPETRLVDATKLDELDADEVFAELGRPVVVKAPSSAFSAAVEKAEDAAQLRHWLQRFRKSSDLIVLQRYAPSDHDWRVGILCGRPLYVARYHMPKGAWRIHDTPEGETRRAWARIEQLAIEDAPPEVVATALEAADAIGGGLYGVDVKKHPDGEVMVIEVNDNPNIDYDGEVAAGSPLWGEIINRIATEGPRAG